jgi:hypothetical protein
MFNIYRMKCRNLCLNDEFRAAHAGDSGRLHAPLLLSACRAVLPPTPLSPWYAQPPRASGLLLGVTNVQLDRIAADCRRLAHLVHPVREG